MGGYPYRGIGFPVTQISVAYQSARLHVCCAHVRVWSLKIGNMQTNAWTLLKTLEGVETYKQKPCVHRSVVCSWTSAGE